jgi:hypothetical protein
MTTTSLVHKLTLRRGERGEGGAWPCGGAQAFRAPDSSDAAVHISRLLDIPDGVWDIGAKLLVREYLTALPKEKLLSAELKKSRREIERRK